MYGKQESYKDVVDDHMPFHLKKPRVSRYVTSRMARGMVALPLNLCRMDGIFGSINSLISNFPPFAPGGPAR
jgi:hypothetical protein